MSAPSKQEIRKVVLASLLGATIEWYDFFLYGVVAGIVFNKLFFPTTERGRVSSARRSATRS